MEGNEESKVEMCIVDSRDITDNEQAIMKGDNVGDTTYSAKWILKTLLSLTKIDDQTWTDELETDLCFLWDMTADKDIVNFLVDNDFLPLAEHLLTTSDQSRLMEIVVGIIGNMCAQPDTLLLMANRKDLITRILELMLSDDTETMIQVLRVLQAALWDIQRDDASPWRKNLVECEFLSDRLAFVLQSSTNDVLLSAVLNLLQSISATKFSDETWFWQEIFQEKSLFLPLVESFNQLIPTKDICHTSKECKLVDDWLAILSNIIHTPESPPVVHHHDKVVDILIRILERNKGNLNPLEEYMALWIHECVEIIHWLQTKKYVVKEQAIYTARDFINKLHILLQSDSNNETIKELLKYLERYIDGQ